jgi:hypothetical protein
MTLKNLPIGIQTFSTIREDNFVYIDKTAQIFDLASKQGRFFLSRPRRFGKSMLISTFQALFEGRKQLFEGLIIENKWDWSKTYPVIRIDFAGGSIQTFEQLDKRILDIFTENQERLGISCPHHFDMAGCFRELIQQAHKKYGQKVVILIDEYDKPILDQIEKPELAAEIREGLKNIYSVMKGQDEYIQFIFMTGVTKFSKVSLFSGINQIEDITLDKKVTTICGYTQHDLQTSFAEHLVGVDWEKLKRWYNGYSFLGESVYNPYDILLFISKDKLYRSYWFETGSPSFLLKLFRKQCYFLPELTNVEVGEEILDSFDVENINPITLLFQAGYLTIESTMTTPFEEFVFRLVIPNQEVTMALNSHFIHAYTQRPEQDKLPIQRNLYDALQQGDLEKLKLHIISLFAGIPWRNFTNNDLPNSEGYYASVLYAFFASINAKIIPEDISNKGQADMTIELGEHIYVIEFKLDKNTPFIEQSENTALAQIKERDYAQKYLATGKTVHQVGMIFNQTARNLVQMDWD